MIVGIPVEDLKVGMVVSAPKYADNASGAQVQRVVKSIVKAYTDHQTSTYNDGVVRGYVVEFESARTVDHQGSWVNAYFMSITPLSEVRIVVDPVFYVEPTPDPIQVEIPDLEPDESL